jgi:hypothetical protein
MKYSLRGRADRNVYLARLDLLLRNLHIDPGADSVDELTEMFTLPDWTSSSVTST